MGRLTYLVGTTATGELAIQGARAPAKMEVEYSNPNNRVFLKISLTSNVCKYTSAV